MPPPFDAPYMERALLAGLLLSVACGLLGTWVVLRGLAFFAHAVGVATFPGVALGIAVPALGPVGGALGAAAAFTAGVGWLERDHRVRGGAVTGIVLAGALALGALLLSTVVRTSAPVESLLFGSLLAISPEDVARCALAAALAALAVALAGPALAAATFDREWARAAGARPARGDGLVLALIALCAAVAIPAVGSLLVSGLLVVPAATARLLSDRLGPLMAIAVGLCALETAGGLALARALDLPPGASVATLAGVAFAGVAVLGKGRSAWSTRAAS